MLPVPPLPPTEASLAYFVVSAATYDIVSELKALLFLVTFGHFTINIVSKKMFEIVNLSRKLSYEPHTRIVTTYDVSR